MSNFRDLIARMAIDAEFARHARANPDAVARQYHLSHDESEQLRGLADAAASAGPTALGARLSKMGGITSAVLSGPFFTGPDTDGDGIIDLFDTDDDNDGIPDASDSQPLVPNLMLAEPLVPPTGPIVTLDPDILNPLGDADGDKIPNILDKNDSNTNTTNEAWGDNDKDGIPNLKDEVANQHALYNLSLSLAGDADGDGIKDPVDSNDSNPNTTNEALGDKDGDGIYNYLDSSTSSSRSTTSSTLRCSTRAATRPLRPAATRPRPPAVATARPIRTSSSTSTPRPPQTRPQPHRSSRSCSPTTRSASRSWSSRKMTAASGQGCSSSAAQLSQQVPWPAASPARSLATRRRMRNRPLLTILHKEDGQKPVTLVLASIRTPRIRGASA
jgi:hypothetical protein